MPPTEADLDALGVRAAPGKRPPPAPLKTPEQRGWLVNGEPQF